MSIDSLLRVNINNKAYLLTTGDSGFIEIWKVYNEKKDHFHLGNFILRNIKTILIVESFKKNLKNL